MSIPRFCVMYSGGLVSYEAARRIVDRHGPGGVVLLFADTQIEDEDLYRFLDETTAHLGAELVRIADGRTPWEVFVDEKFIGNSRIDPCSKILKRQLMDRWRDGHCDRETTTLVYGLDWSERGRIEDHREKGEVVKKGHRTRTIEAGWRPVYPADEKPYLTKDDIMAGLRAVGIEPPRLYGLGFPHNNCGGFCCKMGLAQAKRLLETMPDRYRHHEEQEQKAMVAIGPTAKPMLRFRRKGATRRVSLQEFREIVERQPSLFADHGWGCGGGCAIDG